jgi:serine/threonine protein kinase
MFGPEQREAGHAHSLSALPQSDRGCEDHRPRRDRVPVVRIQLPPGGRLTTDLAHGGLQRLGRFELTRVLGHGAFGTVYKARDVELDRTVAIKDPRACNVAGTQELDRFLCEARSTAQLRHPSLVTAHEVG